MSDNQQGDEARAKRARGRLGCHNGLFMLTIKHLRKCLLVKGLDN